MFSLLSKNAQTITDSNENKSPFFADLNLDQIIEKVTEDWGENVRSLFYNVPVNIDDEKYRRDIFQDIRNTNISEALEEFLFLFRQREEYQANKEKVEDVEQKDIWYLREVASYVEAVEKLNVILNSHSFLSEGMNAFRAYIAGYVVFDNYVQIKTEVLALAAQLKAFRMRLAYENGKFTVKDATGELPYEEFLNECFPANGRSIKSPFLSDPELTLLEDEVVKLFKKKHKDFFKKAKEFHAKRGNYYNPEIMNLNYELGYYLAFSEFETKMQSKGCCFCRPEVSTERLSASGLYDLALACVNLEEEKAVVSNDFELWKEEQFIVLTGPNQGGKTTFARSLGQLIYFTKMGFDVPAIDAMVPHYPILQSHFSVEESVETGKGKLMDELTRLKPMMNEQGRGSFVIINELFTTAANYDAGIMGKQVLEFFTNHGCKGIYVTHLNELSKVGPGVVSFVATMDENHRQTFKVIRSEASDVVGANITVEKYKLTYSQIKERFA